MASQYGIKLAVHIISSHFGNLVSKVCECLLRRGTLDLSLIARYTELSSEKVKKCLLVLIQHNCVQAFNEEQKDARDDGFKTSIQYMALFNNILHRIRFAKFLVIVSEELGKECEEVFEGLLQHGRLTMEQIIDRASGIKNKDVSVPDTVRETFIRLVKARYVERCPAPQPFLPLPDEEEEKAAKKRGPRFAKTSEAPETIEQRAMAAAAPMEAKRFLVITDTVTDVNGENSGDASPSVRTGEKRKHGAFEMDEVLGASNCENEVLWRVNFEEVVRCLRHKACIAHVRSRLDDGAAIVVSGILEGTRSAENKVKTQCSAPLSLNTIYEEVMKSEAGRSMTLDHVKACLLQLGCSRVDELYSIDLNNIIEQAQNVEVESIVLKRYGHEAYKIFRLLSRDSCLYETAMISETVLSEKKDTQRTLYKLWKDDYLYMERVEIMAGRQSQHLLWKVNKQTLWKHVVDEMYHAGLNLYLRVAYELEQENELQGLTKDRLAERFERLKKVRILLESALMKLDDALMLFNDF